MKRLADSTVWPWAAVATSKPHPQMKGTYEARGFFRIKSAVYRAGRLPAQPFFAKKSRFFRTANPSKGAYKRGHFLAHLDIGKAAQARAHIVDQVLWIIRRGNGAS